jgi:uncharacterized protein YjaG (DUF416 family)
MNIQFEDSDSIAGLKTLSFEHQVLFAASVCERLLPVYVGIDFPDNFNHQTLPILRKVLDSIWLCASSGVFEIEQLQELISICHQITLDIEEGQLCATYEAEAPYLIKDLLELCLHKDFDCLKRIVMNTHTMLTEGIDYIMEQEEILNDHEEWTNKSLKEQVEVMRNNEFTIREMQKEMQDWQFLVNHPKLTKAIVEQFRQSSDPNNRGVIDPIEGRYPKIN